MMTKLCHTYEYEWYTEGAWERHTYVRTYYVRICGLPKTLDILVLAWYVRRFACLENGLAVLLELRCELAIKNLPCVWPSGPGTNWQKWKSICWHTSAGLYATNVVCDLVCQILGTVEANMFWIWQQMKNTNHPWLLPLYLTVAAEAGCNLFHYELFLYHCAQ